MWKSSKLSAEATEEEATHSDPRRYWRCKIMAARVLLLGQSWPSIPSRVAFPSRTCRDSPLISSEGKEGILPNIIEPVIQRKSFDETGSSICASSNEGASLGSVFLRSHSCVGYDCKAETAHIATFNNLDLSYKKHCEHINWMKHVETDSIKKKKTWKCWNPVQQAKHKIQDELSFTKRMN